MRHASKVLLVVMSLGFLVGGCTCEKPEPWQLSPPESRRRPRRPRPRRRWPRSRCFRRPRWASTGTASARGWPRRRPRCRGSASTGVRRPPRMRPPRRRWSRNSSRTMRRPSWSGRSTPRPWPPRPRPPATPVIPVIVIGQPPSDPESYDCAVAGDFGAMGAAAAKALAKVVGSTGQVLLLRFQPGGPAAEACEKGFLAAIGAYPGIKVTTSERSSGATPDWAASAARIELKKLGEDNVNGVFSCDDVGLQGMVQLLKSGDYAGKLAGCGYSPPLREAMDAGLLDALVFANPMAPATTAPRPPPHASRARPWRRRLPARSSWSPPRTPTPPTSAAS